MSDHQDSTPPPQSSLRERKKRETRDAIANVAMRLALENGLDGLKIEDIAAEANVSMRTFNNYFGSKSEALAARYADRMRHAAAALRERPTTEPLWEAMAAAIISPWSGSVRGHQVPPASAIAELRLIFSAPAMQAEILRSALEADHPIMLAIAERTRTHPQHDLYPALVAASVTAVVQVAINTFLRSDPPVPLVPLLLDALSQLSRGLPDPSAEPLSHPRTQGSD